jgi:hypothetical protein
MLPASAACELAKPGYRCDPIALGTNTIRTSRSSANGGDHAASCSRFAGRARAPVLDRHEERRLIERDLDILAPMAAKRHGARVPVGHDARPPSSRAGSSRAQRARTAPAGA